MKEAAISIVLLVILGIAGEMDYQDTKAEMAMFERMASNE